MRFQVARVYIHPSTLVATKLLPSHVHVALVGVHVGALRKLFPAQVTTVRPLTSMCARVYPEVVLRRETLVTDGAAERLLTRVCSSVYGQLDLLKETLATVHAGKGLLTHSLHSLTRIVLALVAFVSMNSTGVWERLTTEITGRGLYVKVDGLVPFQTHWTPIALVAYGALEGFQPCVGEQVAPKTMDLCESPPADMTAKGLHACVDGTVVTNQIVCMVKPLSTLPADERLFSCVDLLVFPQVPFLYKGLTTHLALERLFASVYVHMKGELTPFHEGFATDLTDKVLLSCGEALERI